MVISINKQVTSNGRLILQAEKKTLQSAYRANMRNNTLLQKEANDDNDGCRQSNRFMIENNTNA